MLSYSVLCNDQLMSCESLDRTEFLKGKQTKKSSHFSQIEVVKHIIQGVLKMTCDALYVDSNVLYRQNISDGWNIII